METFLRNTSSNIALVLEGIAVTVVVFGSLASIVTLLRRASGERGALLVRHARLRLGRWLVLGLEFQLAADVIRTAIAPSWQELGQLAAVATIRTALNYFLERDLADITSPAPEREPYGPHAQAEAVA
ncbi:MAG: DUF1622 domain-containing protein [Labilithrix sp.]|nr:DUF1622 domain-containing protein [Labilithrix sp.]